MSMRVVVSPMWKVVAVAAACAMLAGPAVRADDAKVPPPPWQVHVSDYVVVGVVWNEATVKKLLPAGIKPSADMSGGIAIYKSDNGWGISPYDSAYTFINVEGFDSAQGMKGRWIVQGLYGPEEKVAAAIRAAYGWQVRAGSTAITDTGSGRRAVASVGGRDVLEVELNVDASKCVRVGGINHYVSGTAAKPVVNQIPFEGDWCGGEPVKAAVIAPADDPFAATVPAKVIWGGEFRNGAIAFTRPVSKP